MKSQKTLLAFLFILLTAAVFIAGCTAGDGGSGNGGSKPTPSPTPQPQPTDTTGTVLGTVTDSETGDPVENAQVSTDLSKSKAIRAIILDATDADGLYELTNVPAGDREILVQAKGYAEQKLTVTVSANEPSEQNFALDKLADPGSITGQVLDSVTSNPVSGVTVTIDAVSDTTDLNGNYTLTGLQSGERTITADRGDYRDYTATVTVTEGQTGTYDFQITPKQWQIETVDSTNVGRYSSLAFAPDGHPAISYWQNSARDLKFSKFNGTTWDLENVKTSGNVGEFSCLAYNSFGQPTISYYNASTRYPEFAFFNGTTWSFEIPSTDGRIGRYSSMAYNSKDEAGIAYLKEDGTRGLYFVKRVVPDTGWPYWDIPQLVDSGANVGQWTSIKFDSNDNPAISYYDNNGSSTRDLKYAYWDGGAWQVEVVDSPGIVGSYTSLAFSPEGIPFISYFDDTANDLKVAYKPAETWVATAIDTGGTVGQYTSIAFDKDGFPAISYYDASNSALKIARFNGIAWVIEEVDNSGSVGQYSSLKFDPDGNPAISYYDAAGNLKYAVKK